MVTRQTNKKPSTPTKQGEQGTTKSGARARSSGEREAWPSKDQSGRIASLPETGSRKEDEMVDV